MSSSKISQIQPKKAQYKKMLPNKVQPKKVQPKKAQVKNLQGHGANSTPRIEIISLLDDDSLPDEYSPPTPPYSEIGDDSIKNNYDPNLDPDKQTSEYIINYLSMKYQEEHSRTKKIEEQQEKTALVNKLAYNKMKKACRHWKDEHDANVKVIEVKNEELAKRAETILENEVEISELRNQLKDQSKIQSKNPSKSQSKNQSKSGKKRKFPVANCVPVDDENALYYGENVENDEPKNDQMHGKSSSYERMNSLEAMEPKERSNQYQNMSDLQILREKKVQDKLKKVRANRQDETDHTPVYVKPKPHKMLEADQPIPMPQENQLKYLEIPEHQINQRSKHDSGSSLSDRFLKIQKTNEEQEKLRREKVINAPDQNNNLQNSTSHRENSSIKSRLGSPENNSRPLKLRNTNAKNLNNQNNKSNKAKKSGKRKRSTK